MSKKGIIRSIMGKFNKSGNSSDRSGSSSNSSENVSIISHSLISFVLGIGQ
jgi:hypothetical protein